MNQQDFARHWQSSPEPDLSTAVAQVQRDAQQRRRDLYRRDLREMGSAVLVALVFVWVLIDTSIPMVRLGAALTLLGAALIVAKLLGARRLGRSRMDDSVRAVLRAELAGLDQQILLLRKVLWWYLLLPLTGAFLVFSGHSGPAWLTAIYGVIVLGLGAWIWRLNQRAWRESLWPERQRLAELIERLDADG
ncbi:hypothetical protein ABMA57_17385 [Saccharospirillum sp. HFRX-1]|uniref:hypothetical protein n=1 Tax=unclassified Saccharospirillum TaxID=2633430 RepID=UPI003718D090